MKTFEVLVQTLTKVEVQAETEEQAIEIIKRQGNVKDTDPIEFIFPIEVNIPEGDHSNES